MPKLHLKRTPAERRERARRKAAKRASSNYDAILEETAFREKMWGALEDDERLDGINDRFNDYAYIPDRWSRDPHDTADPRYMDDDEYAEWVRQGMWKKKHAREYEEQAKRDAERVARRARKKEIRAEAARIEWLAREQQERQARQRQRLREEECRQRYEQRWKALLDPITQDYGPLLFDDIPWPLFPSSNASLRVDDMTPEAISAFLLPVVHGVAVPANNDDVSRRNRDKLKETLLRFHPDKFEGRFMHRVSSSNIGVVREAVGQVARVLNILMNGQSR